MNPPKVMAGQPSATTPLNCSSIAAGMKYMLAMLCSKPAATNAEIGNTIAITLSVRLRPAIAIHTAMQTSTLQSTPRRNAVQNGSSTFAAAICM
jgi:hypothetical protein